MEILIPASVRILLEGYAPVFLLDPLKSELAAGVPFCPSRVCGSGPGVRGWRGGHRRLPSPVLQREASTLRDTTKTIILKWGLLP